MPTAMVDVACDHCHNLFTARQADRERGWARFCSKSCKASHQTGKRMPKPKKTSTPPVIKKKSTKPPAPARAGWEVKENQPEGFGVWG